MRTKILVVALLSSFASLSFAASNVTLYGQLDEGWLGRWVGLTLLYHGNS